jgi:DNA-binding CsgD family transcriptional regulator
LLRSLVDQVSAGAGGVVLVEGEQGIGKSALLRAGFAGAAGAGCRILAGAATETARRSPLTVIEQCLPGATESGAGAPPVPPVLGAVQRTLALVERLCASSPVVLVVEDLHWADEATILVWHKLSRAVGQLPLLLAGSRRPGYGRTDVAWLRRDVLAHGGDVLTLGPVGPADIAWLTAGLTGGQPGPRLTEVLGWAGGNPLYARGVATTLAREGGIRVAGDTAELTGEASPDRITVAAVRERAGALPGTVAAVLRWAAVLGPVFSVSELETLTGQAPAALMRVIKDAVDAGVVAEEGLRLRFRHELIRHALIAGLPSERAAAHMRAARALAKAGASPWRVAAQLSLFLADPAQGPTAPADGAAPDAWAVTWLAAAAPALTRQDPRQAADLLRAVQGRLPADSASWEELEASRIMADYQLFRDGDVERAGSELLSRTSDPERLASVARAVGRARARAGRTEDGLAVITDALGRSWLGEAERTRLRAERALILAALGQARAARRDAGESLAAAERTGDRLTAAHALYALAVAHHSGHGGVQRLGYLDRALSAVQDAAQDGPRDALLTADLRLTLLVSKAEWLLEADRAGEALAAARDALSLTSHASTPRSRLIRGVLAQLHFEAGRWDEALTELEPTTAQSPVAAPALGHLDDLADGVTALIAAHRDDWATADRYLTTVPDGRRVTHYRSNYALLASALAEERAGRAAAAAEVLAGCLSPAGSAHQASARHLLLPPLARLSLAAGDSRTAALAAAAAAGDATANGLPVAAAAADHCRGLVAGDPGPLLDAAAAYESAGRRIRQAQALEDAAAAAAALGRPVAARQALARAVVVYTGLNARWDLRKLTARLRPYGIRPGRRTPATRPAQGWGALTPAELQVASLVASGQSNPDIAAALHLSRNTVQTHVSHILAKLGARSRAEVVRESRRRPPAC